MPFNLLLLPLLGGFLFTRYWNPTRYHAIRAEKERLLILASLAGLVSLIIAFAIVSLKTSYFPCQPDLPCFARSWKRHIPFEYSGTSLLAFALGAGAWYPLNWISKRGTSIDRVIEEDKVPLDLLLKKAQDQTKTVMVTMKNDKVYVGFVIHAFHPALPTRFIQILPTKSGYREDKTKWLHFTIFYSQALDQIGSDYEAKLEQLHESYDKLEAAESDYEKNKKADAKRLVGHLKTVITNLNTELEQLSSVAEDFGVVLPVTEIVSISIYSEYVHTQYFASAPTIP